ncbi:MAG: dTMP kinase [SAR202 cluster bacterium Io17-Chloro-G9]|nr:MAG: dTMP kinase [SAR202 cluster bacterium Io17-Chloro-G9]
MAPFIVFEGGDGSGKTTQAKALFRRLNSRGFPALLTREPGGTPLGESIRRRLKARRDVSPLSELLLFAAARAQLVQNVVGPALGDGTIVVCDRYTASTVAYQGYGRGIDRVLIDQVNLAATGGLSPDLIVLLDLPPELTLIRKRESAGDVFDAAPLEFHSKVREAYLSQAAHDPGHWVVLDATRPPGELTGEIWEKVQPLL